MTVEFRRTDTRAASPAHKHVSLGQHVSAVRPPFYMIIASLLACVVAMVIAVARGSETATAWAAALAASLLIMSGILTNLTMWRGAHTAKAPAVDAAIALQRSTLLTTLSYAWGSLAMFAIYLGTPLTWQHGWQYASVMAIIAIGHVVYLRDLLAQPSQVSAERATKRAVMLAGLQGTCAVVALVGLVMSGKLNTLRDDWAANIIFLAGGITLAILSAIIVVTDKILQRRR